MAYAAPISLIPENDSDYGSEFSPEQEEILERLLEDQKLVDESPILPDIEDIGSRACTVRLPPVSGSQGRSPLYKAAWEPEPDPATEQGSTSANPNLGKEYNNSTSDGFLVVAEPGKSDNRSPLKRFRSPPKKPLSVSDLVGPDWCQLQYWYVLTKTKHGKKVRTPAMKQGTKVHKVLEDQVHTTVRVRVDSSEDRFGLRMWNIIHGLRTLRDTGLTRELEVWGIVEGELVCGVIDELSYTRPVAKFRKNKPEDKQSLHQKTIPGLLEESNTDSDLPVTPRQKAAKTVYIGDVKTRGSPRLPGEISSRPAELQLMLYHRFLSSLAAQKVDLSVLSSRYKFNPEKQFSDHFVAQMSGISNEHFSTAPSSPASEESSSPAPSQDILDVLLAHNNPGLLWKLLLSEVKKTLPKGSASLGKYLKIEYRSRDEGEIIGLRRIKMDKDRLDSYLKDQMQWWKGEVDPTEKALKVVEEVPETSAEETSVEKLVETTDRTEDPPKFEEDWPPRKPIGVSVAEAFKCYSCEFAEGCAWRLEKVEEATANSRAKAKSKIKKVHPPTSAKRVKLEEAQAS